MARCYKKPTDKQMKSLVFIFEYTKQNGISPTMQEISDYMGYSQNCSVIHLYEGLRKKGYLEIPTKQLKRNFILTRKAKDYLNESK